MAVVGEAVGGATVAGAAAAGAPLEPSVGGGEERRTRGRKALPPWVFTILKPEKEKKGEGGCRNWKWDVELKGKKERGLYIGRERGGGGGGE